jgi:cytoskeletal protein RodZ
LANIDAQLFAAFTSLKTIQFKVSNLNEFFHSGKILLITFYSFTLLLCYFVTLLLITLLLFTTLFTLKLIGRSPIKEKTQGAAPSKRRHRAQPHQREDTGRSPIKERTQGAAPSKVDQAQPDRLVNSK